jgi:hypothetical protein
MTSAAVVFPAPLAPVKSALKPKPAGTYPQNPRFRIRAADGGRERKSRATGLFANTGELNRPTWRAAQCVVRDRRAASGLAADKHSRPGQQWAFHSRKERGPRASLWAGGQMAASVSISPLRSSAAGPRASRHCWRRSAALGAGTSNRTPEMLLDASAPFLPRRPLGQLRALP